MQLLRQDKVQFKIRRKTGCEIFYLLLLEIKDTSYTLYHFLRQKINQTEKITLT